MNTMDTSDAVDMLQTLLGSVLSGRMRIVGFNITSGNGFDSRGVTIDGRLTLVPQSSPEVNFEIQVEHTDFYADTWCKKCNVLMFVGSECERDDCPSRPKAPQPEPVKAKPQTRELDLE